MSGWLIPNNGVVCDKIASEGSAVCRVSGT
jgi:hypothetical protein